MADDADDDLDSLIRRVDPDRWLSSRFIVDPAARADAVAVYAYDYELARAPQVASNPLLGEIRLTWWREALDEIFEARPVRRHPTAQALAEAVARRRFPREPLERMIDARYRELDPQPMNAEEAAEWAAGSAGSAALAVAQMLDPDAPQEAAVTAGAAWALGRRAGREADLRPAAAGALRDARKASARLGVAAFPAVAHAALAKTYALGRSPSELGKRLRITLAVAAGRV